MPSAKRQPFYSCPNVSNEAQSMAASMVSEGIGNSGAMWFHYSANKSIIYEIWNYMLPFEANHE